MVPKKQKRLTKCCMVQFTEDLPASILQTHHDVIVIVDTLQQVKNKLKPQENLRFYAILVL